MADHKAGYKDKDGNKVNDFDPYGNFYFALHITQEGEGDIEVAHFSECTGLKNAEQPFEITEGGYNQNVHRRVQRAKWENVILKYASSSSTYMLEWRDKFLVGDFSARKAFTGVISIMDQNGTVLRKYTLKNAWPVSWESPGLNAGASGMAVETLELAHDGIYLE